MKHLPISEVSKKARYNRLLWRLCLGIFILLLGGLAFAEMNLPVSSAGQLQLQATTARLNLPEESAIQAIYINSGDWVNKGDLLLSFEATGAYKDLKRLESEHHNLVQENKFYQALIDQQLDSFEVAEMLEKFNISRERALAVRNSWDLGADKRGLQSQMDLAKQELDNYLNQIDKRENKQIESSGDSSEIQQIQGKISENRLKIQQVTQQLELAQKRLEQLNYLWQQGGISRIEYLKQEAEVNNYNDTLNKLNLEQKNLQDNLELAKQQLNKSIILEEQQIIEQISRQQEQIANYQSRILYLNEKIKQINQNFAAIIAENSQKAKELQQKINTLQQSQKLEKIYSPIKGQVLNIDEVINQEVRATEQDSITIVPEQEIIAQIFIPYQEIPLVQENMKVNITINSWEKAEKLEGKLVSLGHDLLPPNSNYPFYRLAAQVALNKQSLIVNNQNFPLQLGMPVKAEIPIQQKRPLIKIIFDKLGGYLQSIKPV